MVISGAVLELRLQTFAHVSLLLVWSENANTNVEMHIQPHVGSVMLRKIHRRYHTTQRNTWSPIPWWNYGFWFSDINICYAK